jgi:alkylation response protein AidB-like acyl-CoA dehydrogenase
MDFEVHMTYSEEQETFRKEVRAWLAENALDMKGFPVDDAEMSEEQVAVNVEWMRRLGGKGWIVPTAGPELGGAGLSPSHAVVINEELEARGLPTGGPGNLMPGIVVHGTEEQKTRFVRPTWAGEQTVWQLFTEPEAGSDLASLRTRGVRDGDEYVVNGSKQFVGSLRPPDYLYTLVNTNPEAPRHENISLFMIPAKLPGVTIAPMDLIGGGGKQFVFFDNVRVPSDNLIGQEGKGWAITNTVLEMEHGGRGNPGGGENPREALIRRVIDYINS